VSVIVLKTIAEARQRIAAARERGLTIGLVPTMGALHEGHGALMRGAREENGFVVATIFVNPTQFDRPDDFQKYPRTLETDLAFCDRLGVDAVFAPDAAEMYPSGSPVTWIEVSGVGARLEGEFRPGHFRGVATVVAKLFNIVEADRAYFGEKDAQQLAVIQQMVKDLNFSVNIVPVPTVREPDGLAMSSRNQRLTRDQRKIAPIIYKALCEAEKSIPAARRMLSDIPEIRIEYFEAVDPRTFEPAGGTTRPARIAAAVRLGDVRLIDNVLVR
jgi:pantoate--beta-alanine ligase